MHWLQKALGIKYGMELERYNPTLGVVVTIFQAEVLTIKHCREHMVNQTNRFMFSSTARPKSKHFWSQAQISNWSENLFKCWKIVVKLISPWKYYHSRRSDSQWTGKERDKKCDRYSASPRPIARGNLRTTIDFPTVHGRADSNSTAKTCVSSTRIHAGTVEKLERRAYEYCMNVYPWRHWDPVLGFPFPTPTISAK